MRLAFEDSHCRELVVAELLPIAFKECPSFLGLDQGAVDAHEQTLDEAAAPEDRDWISEHHPESVYFYFEDRADAERFVDIIREQTGVAPFPKIERKEPEDWNQKWRAQYTGVDIPPFWKVQPIWAASAVKKLNERVIWMNPSLGFGTGEHPTTQLCLEWLGDEITLENKVVLDFGTGSGILGIGAALLGARVLAVEIDPLALESAKECIQLNNLESQIQLSTKLPEAAPTFNLIVANILRNVLMDHAEELAKRLLPGGMIIVSGLLRIDLPEVEAAFLKHLPQGTRTEARSKGDWMALKFIGP